MLMQPQQPKLFINKLKLGAGKYSATKNFQITAKKAPTQTYQTQTKINKQENSNQNQIHKKTNKKTSLKNPNFLNFSSVEISQT